MTRLCSLSSWFFGCLAFNLAVLCVLAVPQQAWANDTDPNGCTAGCTSRYPPEQQTLCVNRCNNAYDNGCSECAYLDTDAWTLCMGYCKLDFAGLDHGFEQPGHGQAAALAGFRRRLAGRGGSGNRSNSHPNRSAGF